MKSYDDLKTDLAALFDLIDTLGADDTLQQEVMLPMDDIFSKMYVPPEESVEVLHDAVNHKIDHIFETQQRYENN